MTDALKRLVKLIRYERKRKKKRERTRGRRSKGAMREREGDRAMSSGEISSERETDGQEYRHSNKEGKWKREIEKDGAAKGRTASYICDYTRREYTMMGE